MSPNHSLWHLETWNGLCGTGKFQGQRLLSFQLASALRELLLCGCDDIVLRCPLGVNWEEFPTATNIFSPLTWILQVEVIAFLRKGEHFHYKASLLDNVQFSCLTQC